MQQRKSKQVLIYFFLLLLLGSITNINFQNIKILNLNNEISSQKQTISQFNLDTQELKFLRLNLEHGHKCRKSFLNNKGFIVGSAEYKDCVLNKGKIDG